MRPAPAARLSRALVGCYPRRWRERYRQEMLDILDQHQATGRTVLNLTAGALSTHLDPAYRAEGLSMTRLRRAAAISAAIAVPLAVIVVLFGLLIFAQSWKEGHWHVGLGGVTAMAFSPADQHLLVTATSGPQDGLDTLWDVTDPARPRRLANFEGGAPTAFAPDGRTVATVTFNGQPALAAGAAARHWALLRLAGPVPWSARRRASGSAGQGSVHSVTAKPEDAPVTMMRPLGSRSGRLLPPEMVTAWLRTAMRLTDRGLATFQTNV